MSEDEHFAAFLAYLAELRDAGLLDDQDPFPQDVDADAREPDQRQRGLPIKE